MIQFFRNQGAKLATAFVRFPFPLLSGICFAISGAYLIHLRSGSLNDMVLKIVLSSALGLVLFTGLTIYAERYLTSSKWKNLFSLTGLPILLAYYFFTPDLIELPDSKNVPIRFVLLLVSFFIVVMIAPYVKTNQPLGFWQFIKIVISRLIITIIAALILFAGLSLAILSLDHLFSINIDDDLYIQLWFFVVGVFSMIFFLSDIPQDFEILEKDEHYPKLIKIFAEYVLLPLLGVYLIILYLYIGKILLTQNWPNGWVAMPIFIFAAVGIINHIFLYPLLRTNQERWPNLVVKIFYGLLLPTIFMLFAALWKRIEQYGLTELRYLGLIIGAWLFLNAIYQFFNKNKQFKITLISLLIIVLLVSAGPISLFTVAKNNQINRLQKVLQQHRILENNKITPLNIKNLSPKEKNEIHNKVSEIVA